MRSYFFKFLKSFLNSEDIKELENSLTENAAEFLKELSNFFKLDPVNFEIEISENSNGIPFSYLVTLESDGSRVYVESDSKALADLMENPYSRHLSYFCWELLTASSAIQLFKHYRDNITGLRFASSLLSALLLREIGDMHLLNEALTAKLESCQYLMDELDKDHENYTVAMAIDFTDVMVILMVKMMPECIAINHESVLRDLVGGDVEKYYETMFDLIPRLTEIEIEKISEIYDMISEIVSIQALFPFDDERNSWVYR
ncbi:hypothetical protein [Archaeoglobus neptunius]|uniref:hypothetical protein n=1 Tax=Archaeoglobus neptunius TaxID=2798580 RepID=UPI0019251A98|nr:hypothetical protein [Archaeoglobus neptunius]